LTGLLFRGALAMIGRGFGTGRLLAIVAVVIFALVAFDAWPDSLSDDVEPVALGLAFLAAAIALP
jgi:hypothetical protein